MLEPQNRTVTAHHPDGSAGMIQQTDTLAGGDVLPGFTLGLSQLFT